MLSDEEMRRIKAKAIVFFCNDIKCHMIDNMKKICEGDKEKEQIYINTAFEFFTEVSIKGVMGKDQEEGENPREVIVSKTLLKYENLIRIFLASKREANNSHITRFAYDFITSVKDKIAFDFKIKINIQ